MKKPIVAIDISSTGEGGGPYTSTMNLINSALKEKVDYRTFVYRTELGRFISLTRIRDLVRQLKEINPDIVHFTGLQLSGFHIALACKIAKIPKTVVVIRGSSIEAKNIGRIKIFLIGILEILTLKMVTTFYGVSKYSLGISFAKYFKRKNSGHIYNLPPILGEKKVDKIVKYTKKDLGFSDNDIVVVSVARIIKDKGYHILKDAIKINTHISNLKYVIVGEGEYLSEMKKALAVEQDVNKILFLGYRSDIDKILPMCDIFVLPTLHETLSNSLLEASYFKLPLIASRVGGVPEIISTGDNGLLIPPSDPILLAKAIEKLATDKSLRKSMGENACEILFEKFSAEKITNQVYSLYMKLLNI